MFVVAPSIGTRCWRRSSHLSPSDWRVGITFFVSAVLQVVALWLARQAFCPTVTLGRLSAATNDAFENPDPRLGAQYTQLIARRVRELNVYCEIHAFDVPDAFIREFAPAGIILSGGPESVTEGDTPRAPAAVWEAGVPVLGICYGMQTMAAQLGGTVEAGKVREFGYAEVRARGHGKLLSGIADSIAPLGQGLLDVWMSHGDKVTAMPPGFSLMVSNETTPIAGMMDESRRFYAVQFHPEVTHTKQGRAILARFVRDICGCSGDWTMPAYVDEAIAKIRAQVGTDEVILGLSGGVDSSVAAALIHRAIGDQITCIFVDTGLLRLNAASQVMDTFARHLESRSTWLDASTVFLRELVGIDDPG
jgi:GMP synthase (glutamine-hydrolysing)